MRDKDFCTNCGAEIDFNYKEETVCPVCNKTLTATDVMPGWKVETNMNRLKAMHNLMCEANSENIYWTWAALGCPDCPSEDDFFSIALDEQECKETYELFLELIQKKGYW